MLTMRPWDQVGVVLVRLCMAQPNIGVLVHNCCVGTLAVRWLTARLLVLRKYPTGQPVKLNTTGLML
jgi:hypothetical protein